MIRLIASDLDGTLLEPNGTLPEGIFDVIRQLQSKGIRFAAASGRQYGNLRRLFAPVANEISYICENDAVCVADNSIFAAIPFLDEDTKEIVKDIQDNGMRLLISGKQTCYILDEDRKYTDDIVYRLRNTVTVVSSVDEITEPFLKISGYLPEGVKSIAPALIEKWRGRVNAVVAGDCWFDFTVANKGTGIALLCKHLNFRREEVAAFGDNFNDETMLDAVGVPFVMSKSDARLHKCNFRLCDKVLPVLQSIAEADGNPSKL